MLMTGNEIQLLVLCLLVVLVVLVLLVLISVKEECIPTNSIIYRDDIVLHREWLNEKVDGLYVVKTGIYYSITPSFGKKYFCHWSLMVRTNGGHMFVISPTGHASVNVHEVKREYIYSENGYRFIKGGSLGKHIIFSKRLVPDYDVSVNEVVNDMMKVNKSIKYLTFSMNCQYVVSYVLSLYVGGGKIPRVSTMDSFKRVLNDFMFGYKF